MEQLIRAHHKRSNSPPLGHHNWRDQLEESLASKIWSLTGLRPGCRVAAPTWSWCSKSTC